MLLAQDAAPAQPPAQQRAPQAQDGELRRHGSQDERRPLEEGTWLDSVAALRRHMAKPLEAHGVTFGAYLTIDASWLADGGADPGSTAIRHLLDLEVDVESGAAFGFDGGLLHIGFQAAAGEDGSAEAGVAQNVSNIDVDDDRAQFASLWYEQRFEDLGATARAGKMDANALFAFTEPGSHFLHSSMGYSPTILDLPTYPDPSFGLVWTQAIAEGLSASAGVFDGAGREGVRTGSRGPSTLFGSPSDLFWIAELDAQWGPDGERAGRAGLGVWHHDGTYERFAGGTEEGTEGVYVVAEQRLWSGTGERGLDAFLQLGWADEDVSSFAEHQGAGVVWTPRWLGKMTDRCGLGVSRVRFTDEPGAGFGANTETAWEVFWAFTPIPGVRIKPAVQYVTNPGGAAHDDALILTLRTSLSF